MGLATQLAGILKPEVLLSAGNDGVQLNDGQSRMKVTVFGLPAQFTVVKLDKVGHLGKINSRGVDHRGHLRRACDYLLVVESGDDVHLVLIELKETLSDEKPKDQLRRSIPLRDYLGSVCRIEYEQAQDPYRTSVHYCIVCEKISEKLDKRRVRAAPEQVIREENYKDITIRIFVGTSVPLAVLTGN